MGIIRKLFSSFNSKNQSEESDEQKTITSLGLDIPTKTSANRADSIEPLDEEETVISGRQEETTVLTGEDETVTSVRNKQNSKSQKLKDINSIDNYRIRKGFEFAVKRQYKEGDVIGGEFKVEKVFGGEGKSGMGVVYLVTNRKTPLPFILKTIQPDIDDSDSLARFYKEAQAWVSIGWHPNIVRANWAEVIDETLYIAADYIPPDEIGRNILTQYFEDSTPISNPQILRWSAQFVYAMKYAQQKGVRAHRDIKPDNIMIDSDGDLLVTDFGLASLSGELYHQSKEKHSHGASSIRDVSRTETGVGMGTITFMAPEQFEDARSVDHRADIYAFGIILYMMITGGKYPYQRPAVSGPLAFLAYEEMHRTQKHQSVQLPFSFIVDKCLKKQPAERYQSYKELLADISVAAERLNLSLPPKPSIDDDEINELYMQAMAFRGLNQFDKALQAITSFLSHYPDSHIGWTLKGRIFLELGEMKKAITATQRAIDLYPLSSTAWNNLAIAFNKIGENEKSVSAYRQAIYIDPANSGAWMNIVEPLRALGQWDEVVRCTEKAFELTPTKKILHFNSSNLVSFLLQASEVDKALRISRLVSRHNPHDKNNWHNQALIYQSRDDFNNAIKCFHAVEDLESNDTFCLSSLALLYAKTGNTTKALAYCNRTNRWLEPIRAEWGSWQNIGRCYLLLGDNKRAVYYLKKTAELNPQEIPALMDLGVTLERANLNDEAIEIFVKVLEINPDYLSAYNSLALTQMKIGQFDYAQNNYESGIKTLARDLVKSLVNDRLNQILRTPDTQHNLWANYAMTAALYIASQDENIKSVAFPTGETALREARTQAHEGLYWIDQRDDKGNMTRMFLPNYFNTFFSLLSENRFYFRLIGSIGETLKHQGKYEEAKKHFAEADYFKKLNTDFLKLLL